MKFHHAAGSFLILCVGCVLFILFAVGCSRTPSQNDETLTIPADLTIPSESGTRDEEKSTECRDCTIPVRVVSLSPAITEIMYALGLEDRLVGVTRFCKYPPEAQKKTIIGTIFNPNLEMMAVTHPDYVLMNDRTPENVAIFKKYGWRVQTFHDECLEDVFASIRALGTLFHVSDRAENLVAALEERLERLRSSAQNLPPKRVLLVLSRNYESAQLEEVYITGRDGLCEPLLEAAGGVNAYDGTSAFPKVTPEGILSMHPDVILEIVPDQVREHWNDEALDRAWNSLPIPAAQKGNVQRLTESEAALIPGPSMISWAEKAAEKIRSNQ